VAVAAILADSNNVSVLRVDGKKAAKIKELDASGLPELAVFTPDGGYLLIGTPRSPTPASEGWSGDGWVLGCSRPALMLSYGIS
jgi:hypothetical protein